MANKPLLMYQYGNLVEKRLKTRMFCDAIMFLHQIYIITLHQNVKKNRSFQDCKARTFGTLVSNLFFYHFRELSFEFIHFNYIPSIPNDNHSEKVLKP